MNIKIKVTEDKKQKELFRNVFKIIVFFITIIISIITFAGMAKLNPFYINLNKFYSKYKFLLKIREIKLFNLTFHFPDYFFVNLIIFILSSIILFLIINKKFYNIRQYKTYIIPTKINWFYFLLTLFSINYLFLVFLYKIKKFYIIQDILFIFLIILLGITFFYLDKKEGVKTLKIKEISKKEWGILSIFTLIMMLIYSFDWHSWKYAFIGDEYSYYFLAQKIANGFLGTKLLYGDGVANYHPVFTAVIQAVFTKIFPNEFMGWRISVSIIPALGIIPLYIWIKLLFNKNVAKITVASYIFSKAMLAFAHIPYNTIYGILPFIYGMFFLELAMRKNSYLYTFLTSLSMAMGFYTFYPAVLTIGVGGIYYIFHFKRNNLEYKKILIGIGIYFSIIMFIIMDPFLNYSLYKNTVLGGKEIPINMVGNYIIYNFVHGFFSFIYIDSRSHFIIESLVDYITGFGVLVGIIWSIMRFKNDFRAKFLFLSYILLIFVISGLSHHRYPPVTRLNFLAPFLAILGGVGLTCMIAAVSSLKMPKKIFFYKSGIILTLVLIIILNVHYFYFLMPKKFSFSPNAGIIRYLETHKKENVIVFIKHKTFHMLPKLISFYGYSKRCEVLTEKKLNKIKFIKLNKMFYKKTFIIPISYLKELGCESFNIKEKIIYNYAPFLYVIDLGKKENYNIFLNCVVRKIK